MDYLDMPLVIHPVNNRLQQKASMCHIPPPYIILPLLALLLASIMAVDVITTTFILDHGGIELNPIMIGIVGSPLLHMGVKVIAFLSIVVLSIFLEMRMKYCGSLPLIVTSILYIFLAINNFSILIRYI